MSLLKNIRLNILLFVFLLLSLIINRQFLLIYLSIVATLPVIYSALLAIAHKKITVDLLASVALFVSFFHRQWFSVVFINLMITIARIFSVYTENKAKDALASLYKLKPQKVKIELDHQIKIIDLSEIKVGDVIVVESGDRVPVDGLVIEGQAAIDQSSLTGESLPVDKKVGDQVLSSTLAVSGSLIVKTQKIGSDTTLEKIIELIKTAQTSKPSLSTTADKFASIYILSIIVVSLILALLVHDSLLILSFLLVTCADDIAVAVPLALWAAIGRAANFGIIIKGGEYLEGLSKIKMLVLDKTGTLTRGHIVVDRVISLSLHHDRQSVLKYAASAESISEHPVAKAIVAYAQDHHFHFSSPVVFQEFIGQGVTASLSRRRLVVGKIDFLRHHSIRLSRHQLFQIQTAESQGYNIVAVGLDNHLIGYIALADELRPNTKSVLSRFKSLGINHIVMLTGDNYYAAKRVADKLGITEFKANLMPEEKLDYIKKLHKVVFVGDGVNDAASLSAADIGVAMGAIGSDAAIESADLALMHDDIGKLYDAVRLSHSTLDIIRQDIVIWFFANLIGIILVFTRVLDPPGAAAFNFLTDFFPLLNSARLFRYKP